MRPLLKGYIAVVAATAVVLLVVDTLALPSWRSGFSPELVVGLLVLGASHVTAPLGGPALVSTGGAWSDPLAAVVASATYYTLSAAMVAGAVALDQRRSFLEVVGARIGVKAIGEIGLGLVGA